jgi:valyl-tRNA synthetase
MLMMGNYFQKLTPFKKVYVHALVRDEKGQKMSKSKGNVIDPLELINKFGADSLRFTLISMAAPGRDVKLSEDRIKGYRNFLNKIWNSNNFSKINKCKYNKNTNIKKPNLDVNKWIYFELEKTNREAQKHIKNFRFDEAAKIIYQFVWHSYCDWYIEFLKPVFDSKEKKNLDESRAFAGYIQSCILVMLHPFIPFFTEQIWLDLKLDHNLKRPLMYKNWSLLIKTNNSFKNSYKKIDWLIQLVTSIRSTKVDLQISPGSYIEISTADLKKDKKAIINDNLVVFKRLARVTKIHDSTVNKSGVNNIVGAENITLYFNEDVNLSDQKQNLLNKVTLLESKVVKLMKKLENKSFLKNAPKTIVSKEKNSLSQYNVELKKLNSILNSIKN